MKNIGIGQKKRYRSSSKIDLEIIQAVVTCIMDTSAPIHDSAKTVLKNYCLSPLCGCVSRPSHPYWTWNPSSATNLMLKTTYIAHFHRMRPALKALWTRCSSSCVN